jgi:hypothetical protein
MVLKEQEAKELEKKKIHAGSRAVRPVLLTFLQGLDPTVPRYQINVRMDELLHQYAGREDAMFAALRAEYVDRLPQPPVHDVPSLQGLNEQEHLFPVYSTHEQIDRLRPVVKGLLQECNPGGDGSEASESVVSQLLLDHEGREHNLIADLQAKIDERKQRERREKKEGQEQAPQQEPPQHLVVHPQSQKQLSDNSVVFKPALQAMMQEFFPERLGEVDDLLHEYAGREAQMFTDVRNSAAQTGFWEKKAADEQDRAVLIARVARNHSPERRREKAEEEAVLQAMADEGKTLEQVAREEKLQKKVSGLQKEKQEKHMDGLLIAFSNLDPTMGHRLSVQIETAHVVRKEREDEAKWKQRGTRILMHCTHRYAFTLLIHDINALLHTQRYALPLPIHLQPKKCAKITWN